jgi:hypothetical protein
MSQDIGDTCLRSSATPWPGSMLGYVESTPGPDRPVRRPPDPSGGRRPLRRAPRLGLQAQSPLPGRGRGRLRAPLATTNNLTPVDATANRLPRPSPAQRTPRGRPRRRRRDCAVAPGAPPRGDLVAGHRAPHPDPARRDHPRAEQAPPVLLHPVRSSHAEPDLAVGLHPLPAARHQDLPQGHRDHHLARRLHPLRISHQRPPRDHHPESSSTRSAKPLASTASQPRH